MGRGIGVNSMTRVRNSRQSPQRISSAWLANNSQRKTATWRFTRAKAAQLKQHRLLPNENSFHDFEPSAGGPLDGGREHSCHSGSPGETEVSPARLRATRPESFSR